MSSASSSSGEKALALSTALKEELTHYVRQSIDAETALRKRVTQLEEEIERLKAKSEKAMEFPDLDRIVEFAAPISNDKIILGIPNLEKRKEEAIFEALKKFDKKCPYCGQDLYEGHIRSKIEIDHFFPISRGGQDFPWNILPTCKNCNRKKQNTMPYEYLERSVYEICFSHLEEIKKRIVRDEDVAIVDQRIIETIVDGWIDDEGNCPSELHLLEKILDAINPKIREKAASIFKKEKSIESSPDYLMLKLLEYGAKREGRKSWSVIPRRDELRIFTAGLHMLYLRDRDRSPKVSLNDFRQRLSMVPGFLKDSPQRIDGAVRSCVTFRLSSLPEEIQERVEMLLNDYQKMK